MNKDQAAKNNLFTLPDIARMLGFERRTVETRLFTGNVSSEREINGVRFYHLPDAAAAIYRVEFKGA
ncbi:hypothetical protein LPJ47_004566 [Vibrio parahaemolyticus]|nr:hypothetical protein [Vibrio parahaemolyticus]